MDKHSDYRVDIYATPMTFPFNFAYHTWVEISHSNKIQRYDFWAHPGIKHATGNKGHVYLNIFPSHLGTTFSPFTSVDNIHKRQIGKIIDSIFGRSGSVAHELYHKIEKSAFDYPLGNKYDMLLGPNCNTYTQWLINLTPDSELQLPWRAWGKNTK